MIDGPITLAAAGFVVTGEDGNSFQQSRFTGTVLADDDGDRPVEAQLEFVVQER